jgi:hypothetical protein
MNLSNKARRVYKIYGINLYISLFYWSIINYIVAQYEASSFIDLRFLNIFGSSNKYYIRIINQIFNYRFEISVFFSKNYYISYY